MKKCYCGGAPYNSSTTSNNYLKPVRLIVGSIVSREQVESWVYCYAIVSLIHVLGTSLVA